MVNCDDYGRMDARTSILLAKCFPLRIVNITTSNIERLLESLVENGLIFIYGEGKYLQMSTWDKHQQIRAKKSKFPQPNKDEINGNQKKSDENYNNRYQLISDDCICPRNPIQSNTIQSNPIYKDDDKDMVLTVYQNEIGIISPLAADMLYDWIDTYPTDWILEAIKVAVANNARKQSYIATVLDGWKVNGFKNKPANQKQSQKPTEQKKTLEQKTEEAKQRYAIRHGLTISDGNERNISCIKK